MVEIINPDDTPDIEKESIQEYRKLFQSDQMIYVVNKPLTHILPELYEDNNDFLLNNKIIPTNSVNLKKKVLKSNL